MPIFRQIELFLDGTYSKEERRAFLLGSRCICNYVERELKREKFKSNYSRINIFCTKDERKTGVFPLKNEPYLEVRVRYQMPELSSLTDVALQRNYAEIILLGLNAAKSLMPVPCGVCEAAIRQFEAGGFQNKWVQAKKSWASLSLRCEAVAQLTIYDFTLMQKVYRDGEIVASHKIVETKPREMLFLEYFGDFSLSKRTNILYKAKGKVLTNFDIANTTFCRQ